MNQFHIEQTSLGSYRLNGELNFKTINQKTLKKFTFLSQQQPVELDFSSIQSADSAGLALIIELIKISQHKGIELTLHNLPKQIINLSKLCDFEELIISK